MVLLVCGQRDFYNKTFLFETLDKLHAEFGITKIVNGAAKGADKLSTAWAKERGIPFQEYKAQWNLFGKAAGPIRNRQMLKCEPIDMVAAFYWNKESSKGTKDMCEAAENDEIIVREYEANQIA